MTPYLTGIYPWDTQGNQWGCSNTILPEPGEGPIKAQQPTLPKGGIGHVPTHRPGRSQHEGRSRTSRPPHSLASSTALRLPLHKAHTSRSSHVAAGRAFSYAGQQSGPVGPRRHEQLLEQNQSPIQVIHRINPRPTSTRRVIQRRTAQSGYLATAPVSCRAAEQSGPGSGARETA